MALLFVDIDDFKAINDTLGHTVGDDVLIEVARRLSTCCREGDLLARAGGDEFSLVLPGTPQSAAVDMAQQVLGVLRRPFALHGRELYVAASVGISVSPQAGRDASSLRRHADLAMYRAKSRKLGYAVFEQEMNRRTLERLQLASDLRHAVENQELELHYQPQVNLSAGQVVGAEALLRWRHPQLGMVSPAQFIPLAEETGLIVPLGEWVLRQACRQAVRWTAASRATLRIAVNVSALQFERPDFVSIVAACLHDSGLEPEQLELELTESVVMQDIQESSARMTALRALGVRLAVDDFGTGHSSLSYLQRLPLNVLKIDRSFVQQVSGVESALGVVKAIVALAQHLGLGTVAEGIETKEEWRLLRELGCVDGQGFFFGRPAEAGKGWPVTATE